MAITLIILGFAFQLPLTAGSTATLTGRAPTIAVGVPSDTGFNSGTHHRKPSNLH
ncbi:hypothetical protein E1B28_012495 [Marasmius oreades]|uniref:Uncharacterized protein n=1 Tax=Marasmius oreades TaxID=181124 RepID=A0A9P7RRL2_9AGAR|nr:uncharacterized protein E1B28_012495 [Marasmius oreades]KAG7088511.1 hypothetical protein E1B28_012495 [Marasmius oreades]